MASIFNSLYTKWPNLFKAENMQLGTEDRAMQTAQSISNTNRRNSKTGQ